MRNYNQNRANEFHQTLYKLGEKPLGVMLPKTISLCVLKLQCHFQGLSKENNPEEKELCVKIHCKFKAT